MRYLIILLILFGLIWFFFLRKPRRGSEGSKKCDSESMIECKRCGTYVSQSDCFISGGDYFCSQECLDRR